MNPVHTFTPYLCNVHINIIILSYVVHVVSLSHDFRSFDDIMLNTYRELSSSGLWRRVVLKIVTRILEEFAAYIFTYIL
jgi:hypothetical protein